MDNDLIERSNSTMINNRFLNYLRFPFLDQYETWLFTISFSVALFLGISTPFFYTAESDQYLKMAWYLLGDGRGEYPYYQMPGFPLLMILTMVPFLESFWGLIAIHVIMGTSIPVLVYRTFINFNAVFAKLAASLILVSLIPYNYMTHILPEQGLIFLLVLSVLLFSYYLKDRSPLTIILLTLVLFLVALFKFSASLIIIPFFIMLCLLKKRSWWHIFLSLTIFLSLVLGYSAIRAKVLNPPGKSNYMASIGELSGTLWRQLTWNIYGPSRTFNYGRKVLLPLTKEELYETLRLRVAWNIYGPSRTLNYGQKVLWTLAESGLTHEEYQNLFEETTPENFSKISSILDERFGAVEADQMCLNMTANYLSRDWTVLFVFWDSIVQFFLGYDLTYDTGKRNQENPISFGDTVWSNDYNSSSLSKRMQAELADDIINLRKYYGYIWGPIKLWQFSIKILAVIVGFILVSCWWRRELHYIFLLNVLIIGYQALVTVLFANPTVRHVDLVIPMMLIFGSGGAYYCFQLHKGKGV